MSASLSIQKSAAKTTSLSIQKSVAKNCVVVDSKIDNQKICRCWFRNRQQKPRHYRFKNRQPKTMPLLIQKSTTKTYVVTDSEISSDGGVISTLLLFFFFFWCLQSVMAKFNMWYLNWSQWRNLICDIRIDREGRI